MIVVTRNHLWLVDSHHKGPSNADVTALTKIIPWLQKYSWYHLWDHFSGLILDTSATENVWFNSDFILLNEFSYTYLHQASKHQQQIHVKNRTWPHQSADIHIGIYYLPKFHRNFCKYVRLTVCLSVRLSVCLARDTGRIFLTIVTKLGPHMKSWTRKNPIVFLGQRSNNWVTR